MVPKGSQANCTIFYPHQITMLVSIISPPEKKFPGTPWVCLLENDILTSVMTPMPGHGNQITECARKTFPILSDH